MAILRDNSVVRGFSGAFGDMIVYKQYNGKTLLTRKASAPVKQSERQRENRNRFRMATDYAHYILNDPEKKAYYQQKAKKLKLPNAYTAAITDYLRKSDIREINTQKFNSKTGGEISVVVTKRDFAVREVSVSLYTKDGTLLEQGLCTNREKRFYYTSSLARDEDNIIIRVSAGVLNSLVFREVLL